MTDAVTDVIAAGKRIEPILYEEWLRLDKPLEGAGPAADHLREQLEAAAEYATAEPSGPDLRPMS